MTTAAHLHTHLVFPTGIVEMARAEGRGRRGPVALGRLPPLASLLPRTVSPASSGAAT